MYKIKGKMYKAANKLSYKPLTSGRHQVLKG